MSARAAIGLVAFQSTPQPGERVMYHRYFGMKHRPFTATPQTTFYYPAPHQEEALATLHYTITQGRGIGVLTGLPGTGKTLVCHRLTTQLEPAFTTAMITNTNIPNVKGLLQAILYDLSLPFHGLDEQELRLTLTDFLLGKYAGGGRMVLVIDEAQKLSSALLEELRMFSNLEGESDKLFQIVLAGHPRLLQSLRDPELETLSQRIGARATIPPFSDEETVAYIQHLVGCAGARWDEVFSYDALCAVYEITEGNPRRINQLCDHSLLRAYVTEMRRVDSAIVAQAAIDLDQAADVKVVPGVTVPAAMDMKYTPATLQTRSSMPEFHVAETSDTFVACTECEGSLETLEISTSQLIQDADPLLALSKESCYDQEMSPSCGEFAEEELVIDPYAMMDAARTRMMAAQPTRQPVAPTSKAGYCEPVIETARDTAADSSYATDVRFVESADNPAVHEVGAGMINLAAGATESPILVIENKIQRIGGHIARVDAAQQPSPENRGYRRLFTHARKS
jgi:type II secretory pathway predicted ATPase ExeA